MAIHAEALRKLLMEPDEILVVMMPPEADAEDFDAVHKTIDGLGVRYLVVPHGYRLGVVKPLIANAAALTAHEKAEAADPAATPTEVW